MVLLSSRAKGKLRVVRRFARQVRRSSLAYRALWACTDVFQVASNICLSSFRRAAPGNAPPSAEHSVVSSTVLPFVLCLVVRLAYLLVLTPPFESTYWDLSTGLLQDGSLAIDGKAITDFEPLYPLFLAVARWLSRDQAMLVQVFQALIASLGTVYVYRLARALAGRGSVAAIAASLYALDPLLVRQAVAPSDLALATTLLVAFAYYFVSSVTPIDSALAGVMLGLVILTRSMTVPLAALAALAFVAERRFSRSALMLAAGVLVLVLPFLVRNLSVNGSSWPTRSGLNLYIGNSPYSAAILPDHDPDMLQAQADDLIDRELADFSGTQPEYDRAADALLTRHAVAYMAEDPLRTLRQKALNGLYFFSPRLVPFYLATAETRAALDRSGRVVVENPGRRPRIEGIAYAVFYAPVLVAALFGIFLRRRCLRQDAILWCITATFVVVHALYFPATRYRAPMEFVLMFYAAVALQFMWDRRSVPSIDARVAVGRH